MGLGLEKVHELTNELKCIKQKLAPLHHRWRRAGSFKTRDRIDARIEAVHDEIRAVEKKLINSWGG